ncbi:MAG TPA: pentapeptide repeat-containing protein [Chlorobaculum sp.]|nr:pentapeptide repeat-containing protein [Chlorobaculum sp.]
MSEKHTEPAIDRVFEKIGFDGLDRGCGVYEECRFRHCNFSGADLSGVIFRNCTFESCDISLAKLAGTGLQEVRFVNSKLLGLNFIGCRKLLLRTEFERCMLKLAVFNGLDMRNTKFADCDLREADFTNTNLGGASFGDCDLRQALFFHTNLENADFRTAFNYSIPPETNRIRKAKFSIHGLAGLLEVYEIEIE